MTADEHEFRSMTTAELIASFRKDSLAHDTHSECVAGAFDREVIRRLEKLVAIAELPEHWRSLRHADYDEPADDLVRAMRGEP